jgi:hypothetical protein
MSLMDNSLSSILCIAADELASDWFKARRSQTATTAFSPILPANITA